MKAIAITNKGIEKISSLEIKEILKVTSQTCSGGVIFPIKKYEDLFLLCYRMQTAQKIGLLLGEFEFSKLSDLKDKIKKLKLKEWLDESFVVRSVIRDSNLGTQEVESKIGEFIFDEFKTKVDLSKPQTTFLVYIVGKKLFFGVDFSISDLSKRDYRVFTTREIVKPNTAYALARIAGFSEDKTLLDPFCLAGTIPIEVALYAGNVSPHYFSKEKFLFSRLAQFKDYDFKKFFDKIDKKNKDSVSGKIVAMDSLFHNINASKKNAKIAGINKLVTFSRLDVEWIDTKFKKDTVDFVVTAPPQPARHNLKMIEKLYKEFFHQTEFVVKKGGKIVLLIEKGNKVIKELAKEYGFVLKSKQAIWQGKKELEIVVFDR